MMTLDSWEFERARRARSGTIVALLRRRPGGESAYLKVATERHGVGQLEREWRTLKRLHDNPGLRAVRPLIPVPLAAGDVGGSHYLLQQALPGAPAASHGVGEAIADRLIRHAVPIARDLHRLTAKHREVGPGELDRWIAHPLSLIDTILPGSGERLHNLRSRLTAALTDSRQLLGWVHGDYWFQNLLLDPQTGRIVGIVDWDSADADGLALHDQLHLVLSSRKMLRRGSIGTEVQRALEPDAAWSKTERVAVAAAVEGFEVQPPADPLQVAVILYWLRLVAMNMTRQPRTTASNRWIRDNVASVVAHL